jgi:hypothetical protein
VLAGFERACLYARQPNPMPRQTPLRADSSVRRARRRWRCGSTWTHGGGQWQRRFLCLGRSLLPSAAITTATHSDHIIWTWARTGRPVRYAGPKPNTKLGPAMLYATGPPLCSPRSGDANSTAWPPRRRKSIEPEMQRLDSFVHKTTCPLSQNVDNC